MLLNGKHELNLPADRAKQWQTWADRGTNWEPERLDSIMAALTEDSLIFDIGTERGDFPALWSTTGAQVVMVEPNPLFWPEIREVWSLNNEKLPLGMIVGFASHTASGFTPGITHPGSWPAEAMGEYHPDPGFHRFIDYPEATIVTIDQLAEAFGPPTHISMDIEGAELQALRGGVQTFTHIRPDVWVSVHPDFMPQYNDTKASLLTFMDQMLYEAELLATDHEEHWLFTPRP